MTTQLQPYFAVADGLAALFAPFVEVIVHDLKTDCVAYVAQPLSPRAAGDPSDLREISFSPNAQVIGPYEKINWDGRRIKSVSVVLRDSKARPVGLLCVNADVMEFDAVQRLLQGFLSVPTRVGKVSPRFRDDWHEKVNRFVAAWTAKHGTTVARMDRAGRQALIAALFAKGGFDGKRAPAYVAALLGVSRATVYNQLARLKQGAAK